MGFNSIGVSVCVYVMKPGAAMKRPVPAVELQKIEADFA